MLSVLPGPLKMIETKTSTQVFFIDFIAGGVAGAVSRTCVSPLERLKIIFQLRDGKGLGMLGTLKNIWKSEGISGMLKGNGTNIIRIFPYSAVQFASYEFAKKNILKQKNSDTASLSLTSLERMFAGAFAGICSVTTTYPLDIIRTRLSLDINQNKGKTIISCGKDIIKHEGGTVALYRGLSPTIAGIAPYVALNFTVYEGLKAWLLSKDASLDIQNKLMCGGFAGAIAQTFTYPFDVVRRRMQVTFSPDSKVKYKGSFDAASQIVKKDGICALFKGIIPNYIKVVPAISISFVTFEFVRNLMV